MSLVNHVKQIVNAGCLVSKCRKKGCSLTMKGLPQPHILIDLDHATAPAGDQGDKKCDYIFIGDIDDGAWVAPLELKRGKLNASEVVPQLQAGARVAERLVPRDAETRFRPIAVYGGELHAEEYSRLRGNRIRFFNQRERPQAVRSGSPLASALKET